MQSDDVLKVLEPGLIGLGFVVEQGKTKTAKLPRPVFFGDEGKFLRTLPTEYRYKSGGRTAKEPSYAKTYSVVEAIYGSPRLSLPFEGVLLVGY